MTRQPRIVRHAATVLAALLLIPAIAACASNTTTGPQGGDQRTLVVFAAASLRDVFTQIGGDFQNQHPGVTVRFAFAGSSDLVAQIGEGAAADVLATADATTMTKAIDARSVARTPVDFATNTLTIVTPPGNPREVNSFADLAQPGLRLVVCAPHVPCGAATAKVAQTVGVALAPVSEENSVTDVLGKVMTGQADAGVVYKTDASAASGKVAQIPFPESNRAVNRYPIVPVVGTHEPDLAQQFCDYVTSDSGRSALALAGFGTP